MRSFDLGCIFDLTNRNVRRDLVNNWLYLGQCGICGSWEGELSGNPRMSFGKLVPWIEFLAKPNPIPTEIERRSHGDSRILTINKFILIYHAHMIRRAATQSPSPRVLKYNKIAIPNL